MSQRKNAFLPGQCQPRADKDGIPMLLWELTLGELECPVVARRAVAGIRGGVEQHIGGAVC
jgi:hypothetical protein